MASHLGAPVGELKHRMSYNEFLEWTQFLQLDEARDRKTHYYLAQVAMTIAQSVSKAETAQKMKLADFMLRSAPVETPTPEQQTAKSKSAWDGALKGGGKNPNRKGPKK